MKRIAVLTSGGDAPGMNAALRAVVRQAIHDGVEVLGVEHGFSGLLRGGFVPLSLAAVGGILHRGGTVLFTARCEEFKSRPGQEKAVARLREARVDGLVVIGGDGSFRGAQALHDLGFPVVGIPATIDDDIPGTEHAIGFDTAVNTAVGAIDRIRDTATSHERIFVIEVMGRDTGHLAVAVGLAAGAESVLIPEYPESLDKVCWRVKRGRDRGKKHDLIVVAEGASSAYDVARAIATATGYETRVTVLGHTQRGGSPTAYDRMLASQLGAAAVGVLGQGHSAVMVGRQGAEAREVPFSQVVAARRPLDRRLLDLCHVLAI
ncbi:MAG TPA: 6-phosphofructokinase [Firmicutes bacterium]|nr:6-phosphofructokinase [Bacillota bacterium]